MNHAYLISLLKNHKRPLLFAITLMIIESLVSLSVPWFAGKFSQSILENQTFFGLSYIQIGALWLALFIFQALLRFLSTYRVSFVGATMLTQLSCRLYDHIQMLPIKYFNTTKKGETLALLGNDVTIISYFLSGVITSLVPTLCLLLGAIILMFSINTIIALTIICMIPIFILILKILGKGISPLTKNIVQQQANSAAIANENFSVIKLVKAFNRESQESARFRNNAYEIQKLRKKQLKAQSILSPLIQLLISTGVLIVIVICAINYQSGQLTMPQLVTLLMYGMLFARPMSNLAQLYGQVQQAKGASTRIIDVLKLAPEPTSGNHLENIAIKGHVSFANVTFDYKHTHMPLSKTDSLKSEKGNQQPLLNNVSFELQPGSITVLLGENGQGKSTILHLLMRFIEPNSGSICIDQYPLNELSLATIRKHVGLVSHDIALCNGTIIENIAYGYPDATFEEIKQVAIAAGADKFINQFSQGYQTNVGENGVLLSGGQRQKISLARTLLCNPAIFLLDEPTSMIDKESKADFQQTLKRIFKHKTVIIVTHDNDMTTIADQIIQLSNGVLK